MIKVIKGINDLKSQFPKISEEIDFNKNQINADDLYCGSSKELWWKCSKGHSYKCTVYKRTKEHRGCPYCSGHRVSPETCVAHLRPDLLNWFDEEKNNNCSLYNFTKGSSRVIWWKCPNGHSFKQTISQRVNGKQCPVCCGQLVTIDNCLATTHPNLISEWHPTKNGKITPFDVTHGTKKKYWWKCPNGHEYLASVCGRSFGTGCPICDSEKRTSFPEQAIGYYLAKVFDVEYRSKILGSELDIYIPKLQIGIEYDGAYFHNLKNSIERDERKNQKMQKNSILLIRIKEHKNKIAPFCIAKYFGYEIHIEYKQDYHFIEDILRFLADILKKKKNVTVNLKANIDADRITILEAYTKNVKSKSLLAMKPIGAQKWDYSKNGILSPDCVPAISKKKFYWKCPTCGNTWFGKIENVTNTPFCKKCAHSYQVKGKIDYSNGYSLLSCYPELCKEYDYSKNAMDPSTITPGSNLKVWWKCKKCGFEWFGVVKSRTSKGCGCPACAQKARNESKFKKVINLDTGDIYESVTDASNATKITRASITTCLRKRSKTAGGFHWEYFK